jgi:Do/DeqQ family serine protease
MNAKKIISIIAIAFVGAIAGAFVFSKINNKPVIVTADSTKQVVPSLFASTQNRPFLGNVDFTGAAEMSVNAVVHVKTVAKSQSQYQENPLYEFFFGPRGFQQQPVMGSGSGVIISSDGYIVTNNHVIDGADNIEVVLNDRRSFDAHLIGTDPSTDIALLKIDASGLMFLGFGDSDQIRVGEWVLAVGNPFNLTSTVTAGIVSAKSRNIGILANSQTNMGIESFIQTDAAVNPGNSGGALVNTSGQLIGINTAIASRTGSYTGYSFAVPANIVRKVSDDLKQYGEVQRGLLGISIGEVNKEIIERLKLDRTDGVFVAGVADGGGAKEAGIQENDVIISVDGESVSTVPQLQEKVGRKRPGDKVKIEVIRSGKVKPFVVTLRSIRGTTEIVKVTDKNKILGAVFEPVTDNDKKSLRINYGLKIVTLNDGKLKQSGVQSGFIITKANRMPVSSVQDFERIVGMASEGLFLTGIYPNGRVAYYAINLEE